MSDNGQILRLLDDSELEHVVDELKSHISGEGELQITAGSWWGGGQRWARNRAVLTSGRRDVYVFITRRLRGAMGLVSTNQIDSASLKGAAEYVEHYVKKWAQNTAPDIMLEAPEWKADGTNVWSDATFARTPVENGETVTRLAQKSELEGLLSAGYIETTGSNVVRYNRDDWGREKIRRGRVTQAQCSVTVRHPKATGSGWAGGSSFDLQRIDIPAISDLAFEKCVKSLDPVRMEPGRYQTILDPQATATFASFLVGALKRTVPESGYPSPMLLGPDASVRRFRSKLGIRVVDERITIHHNPDDPIIGTHVSEGVAPVVLINKGVLTSMYNDYSHSIHELSQLNYNAIRSSFKMDGNQTSMEEMIQSTARGLLVTRVSTPRSVDPTSMLLTGLTRDGLWLIESGKITRAVKNFRWTESPLFIFNNVEQLGESVPVFSPKATRTPFGSSFHETLTNISVPAIKVNDFSFTSTVDAI